MKKTLKRSKKVEKLVALYNAYDLRTFLAESVDCSDPDIIVMRYLCYCLRDMSYMTVGIVTKKMVEVVRARAEAGDPVSQANMGFCAECGLEMSCDEKESLRWFEAAAKSGYPRAQNAYALRLWRIDWKKNRTKIIALFKSAYSKGCKPAAANLGKFLDCYPWSKAEMLTANRLLRKAWEYDILDLRCIASDTVIHHPGCPYVKAGLGYSSIVELPPEKLKRLARTNLVAKTYFAYQHMHLGPGYRFDEKKAVRLYEEAANAGVAAAQNMLGECYYRGMGCAKDDRKAAYWFRKAAKQGEPDAIGWMGFISYHGIGCRQNVKQSVAYNRKAAELGNLSAQYNLAMAYLCKVKGCRYNPERAVDLLWTLAAYHGKASAMMLLGKCYLRGEGVPKDVNRGLSLMATATACGEVSHDEYEVVLCKTPCYLDFYERAKTWDDMIEPSIFKMLKDYGNRPRSTSTGNGNRSRA